MSSVLQGLLLKLKPQLLKREEWSKISTEHQLQLFRIQKVSEAFISLIILLISSNDKLAKLKQYTLAKKGENLLTALAETKHVSIKTIKRIIGLFITKEFEGENKALNNLKQQFAINYDEEDSEQEDELISNIQEEDNQSLRNALNDLDENFGFSFDSNSTVSNIGERKSSELKGSTQWGQDMHYMRVMGYLKEHSSPPTQLTYLCQEFGWHLSYTQDIAQDGQFQVSAKVSFSFKKVTKDITEKFTAKQKKIGRIVASFKMLKKIYLNFPQIWDIYESKRSKKSMYIESNQFNPLKLIDVTVIQEKVEEIAPKKSDRSEQIKKQREDYLSNIQNYKSQYNILNQNNPGLFPIVYDKIQVGQNKWKVRGTMQIKYKSDSSTQQACQTQLNSKLAQQMVTKTLVTKVYQRFHEIMEKMSMIKKKKGIRT